MRTRSFYDPKTGQWRLASPMRLGGADISPVLLQDGRVLMVGGEDCCTPSGFRQGEIYDPHTDTWSLTGRLSRVHYAVRPILLHDGRVLLAGGDGNGFCCTTRTTEVYDPTTNQWSTAASMHVARDDPAVARLCGGKILVAGGGALPPHKPVARRSAEVYDPTTNTWTLTPPMPFRTFRAGAFGPDHHRFLVTGGETYHDYQQAGTAIYHPDRATCN